MDSFFLLSPCTETKYLAVNVSYASSRGLKKTQLFRNERIRRRFGTRPNVIAEFIRLILFLQLNEE